MADEVVIVVTAKDRTGPAFDSARRGAKQTGSEGGSAISSLTGKMKGLGVAAAASAALIGVELAKKAIGALIDYSKKSITAASDLNESMNAVNVIFGKSAGAINKWGKEQASAFGLSQRAFNELATPLGALLKNTGVAQDQLAGKTIELTKRASDLASVFNTDVSTALEAMTSGLKGEFDPLEQYGVHINAAMIETEALAETHKKSKSSLTDAEKATASYNLILKQTNIAAGDFKNTSDGLANSSRILAARQEELSAKFGQKLLPAMNKINEIKLTALQYISDVIFPKMEAGAKLVSEGFMYVWQKALPPLIDMVNNIKQAWEDNQESIQKLMPLLKDLGILLGVTLVAALIVVGGLVGGFIIWLGKAGDAFALLEHGVNSFMVSLLKLFGTWIDGFMRVQEVVNPVLYHMLKGQQEAFHKWANGIINDIQNAQAVARQGINVSIRVGGLSQLSNAIHDVLWLNANSAHAGISKAHAAGGIANGLSEVGERGGELIKLPQGSMVYSNANSNQMLQGMGGKQEVTVNLVFSGNDALSQLLNKMKRDGKLTAFA